VGVPPNRGGKESHQHRPPQTGSGPAPDATPKATPSAGQSRSGDTPEQITLEMMEVDAIGDHQRVAGVRRGATLETAPMPSLALPWICGNTLAEPPRETKEAGHQSMTRQTPTCLSPSCRAQPLPCSASWRSSLESCCCSEAASCSFRVRVALALLFGIPQLVIGLTSSLWAPAHRNCS